MLEKLRPDQEVPLKNCVGMNLSQSQCRRCLKRKHIFCQFKKRLAPFK
jgi:hypothetical protein